MQMLAYVSNARIPAMGRKAAMRQLSAAAQKRNDELGISGVLFLRGNTFLQTIEGPDDALREVFQSIVADNRHDSMCVLVNEAIEQRMFSGWSLECFHDHYSTSDFMSTLQDINERFDHEPCFTASNVYSYFSSLAADLAPYRLSTAA